MSDLATQMRENYREHPSFRFDQPALEVGPDLPARFDDLWKSVRNVDGPATGGDRPDLGRCRNVLGKVFAALGAQAPDEHSSRFLEELHTLCADLLTVEYDVHRRRWGRPDPSGPSSGLAGRSDRASARHFFGRLPHDVTDELAAIAAGDVASFRERARSGRLSRDDLSVNTGRTVWDLGRVLNRAFTELSVNDAVSTYTGRSMSVSGLALELSVTGSTWWRNGLEGLLRSPETLYAHLDESIAVPKAIVYLSDVGPDNGPTGAYPGVYEDLGLHPLQELVGRVVGNVGNAVDSPLNSYYRKAYHQSVTSERFRRHFMLLPEEIRFNSHLGWDVLPGGALEESLAGREVPMVGEAGQFIVFDGGSLLHRGGLVHEGERVALQVVFAHRNRIGRLARRVKHAVL